MCRPPLQACLPSQQQLAPDWGVIALITCLLLTLLPLSLPYYRFGLQASLAGVPALATAPGMLAALPSAATQ